MPIGKDKKSVQSYVKNLTKETLSKMAKDTKSSESKISGAILEDAITRTLTHIEIGKEK